MKKKKETLIIGILVVIVLLLSAMLSRRLWFRLDLTQNKMFTISQVSRDLHLEIPDQVQITYFLSDRLKSMHPIPGEIEDFLREYAGFSRGKIRLIVRDPAKANMTQVAEQLGVIPQQIQTVEQDQASVATVYTGIVIEHLDQVEVLPVVFSLETLEYDLTTRIRSMIRGSSRILGVLIGDQHRRQEDFQFIINTFFQAGYQLRPISPDEEISDAISALLVLGGAEAFDEEILYNIDDYIQRGGRVLFSVNSVNIDLESLQAQPVMDRGLLAMLSAYGVTVLPEIVMDQTALTMQLQSRSQSGITQIRIIRNPQWIRVQGENSNRLHPVSTRFSGLDMYWANPLVLYAPEGVAAVPLFSSTNDAWTMREPFILNPEHAHLFDRDANQTRGMKILGASLSGIFPSFFNDDEQNSQARAARVIVVGNVEFATALINMTGGQRNLDFLVQAADWLCNDDDIIGIRSRAVGSGRLDKIFDAERQAAAMRFARFINIYFVPFLVIVAGLSFAMRRRALARSRTGETDFEKAGNEKEHHHDV